MPQSGILANWKMTEIEKMLVQNPTVGYFPITCTDYPYSSYPQGVPRSALIAVFQNHAAECKTGQTLATGTTLPFSNQSYGNTAAGNTAPVNNAGAIVRAEDVV